MGHGQITFNETLSGFDATGGSADDTIADFEAAYARGKEEGSLMGDGLAPPPPTQLRDHDRGA